MSASNDAKTASRASLLQSPWYWAYAFCAAGLAALVLMGGKFSARQSQIERQHQGRQRASSIAAPHEEREEAHDEIQNDALAKLSTSDSTIVSLTPLYALLSFALIASWAALWWTHFRRRRDVATSVKGKTS